MPSTIKTILSQDVGYDDIAESILTAMGPNAPQIEVRSLGNGLRKTDNGTATATWWTKYRDIIPFVAKASGFTEEQVGHWVKGNAPQEEALRSAWLPGQPPIDTTELPLWLAFCGLMDWLDGVVGKGPTPPSSRAWLAIEPGLPRQFMLQHLRERGWKVLPTDVRRTWDDHVRVAVKRASGDQPIVIDYTGSESITDRQRQMLLAIDSPLIVMTRQPIDVGRARTWTAKPNMFSVTMQHLHYRDSWVVPQPFHVAVGITDHPGGQNAWLKTVGLSLEQPTTYKGSSMLDFLTQIGRWTDGRWACEGLTAIAWREDAKRFWESVSPDLTWDDLIAAESRALHLGTSERGLDTWQRLLDGTQHDDKDRLRTLLKKQRYKEAQDWAESGGKYVAGVLRTADLLVPLNPEFTSWGVWPQWVGEAARQKARERALKTGTNKAGLALLHDEPASGLDILREVIRKEDWKGVRERLPTRTAPDATILLEAMSHCVGEALLDGEDVPVGVVRDVIDALTNRFGPVDELRTSLLVRIGNARLNPEAVEAALWALGHRVGAAPGPWGGAELKEDDLTAIEHMNDTYLQLLSQGETTERRMRFAQLGVWLFDEHKLIPNKLGVFDFQGAAIARFLAEGGRPLGESVDEVLNRIGIELTEEEIQARNDAYDLRDAADNPDEFVKLFQWVNTLPQARNEASVHHRDKFVRDAVRAASYDFAVTRGILERTGQSLSDVLAWLWSHWAKREDRLFSRSKPPPIYAVKHRQLEDARVMWRAVPKSLSKDLWVKAATYELLWDVLEPVGWERWMADGGDEPEGWERIPEAIVLAKLPSIVSANAHRSAWQRNPDAVMEQLTKDPDEPFRTACFDEAPSDYVPALLEAIAKPPRDWLQRVVANRHNGWLLAWQRLNTTEGAS
ncbi:MAG: hypothetical protein ACJAZO_003111 [Myxococcota bacterium]|jgi:hypothetical protein